MATKTKAQKFPKSLGACIDLAYDLRAKRLDLQREQEEALEALKADEKAINEHIINTFSKADIEGARGYFASASIVEQTLPTVKDWSAFWAYIAKHKAFDLLEKRPARVACKERWEAGEELPGVEKFIDKKLSLTKIGK